MLSSVLQGPLPLLLLLLLLLLLFPVELMQRCQLCA
jgi:hypothetical protein